MLKYLFFASVLGLTLCAPRGENHGTLDKRQADDLGRPFQVLRPRPNTRGMFDWLNPIFPAVQGLADQGIGLGKQGVQFASNLANLPGREFIAIFFN